MDELSKVLAEATAAIGAGYFRLNIDGGAPVYRERVYCYELYHQMRLRWPDGCEYSLNGEVDKRAHPILRELSADLSMPDLLVHTPGHMSGNHAIIEVKSARANSGGIRKDLKTLSLFVRKVEYERAIYLVYGDEISKVLIGRIEALAAKTEALAPIELWVHPRVGAPAENILLLK